MKDILSSNYETFIDAEKSCESEDPETNSKQFQNLSLPIWDETPTFKLKTNQLQEQQEIIVQSQKQSQQHQSFPCCQKIELSKHAPLSHTYRQENQQMQQNENLSQHFQRKCPIQTFQQESEMKICQQKLPLPQQASLRKNPTNNDDHTYETLGSDALTKKNQTQDSEVLRPSPDQNISVENLKPIELSSFQNEDEGFQTNSLPSTPKSNKIRISSTQKNRHGSINQKYTSFSKPEKLITEERDEFLSLSAAEIYEISKNSNRKVENQVIITVPTINKGVDKINLKSIESEEFLKDFTYSDSSAESHKNISGSSSDTQN
ncbi:hypothetical protein Avbf_18851 [Armadillidium vulgare]|nr:hypothetical protein Avbf_18851 [Armadillidium vulgare]